MKKSLFLGVIILSIMGVEIFGTPAISNWRWRNDNGNETSATWKAPENDSVLQSNESNIRLRMQIYHTSSWGPASPVSFPAFLYYASLKDTIWHLVSEDPTDAFMFSLSSDVTNGGITTEQLTPVASMVSQPGIIREMSGSFDFSLNQDQSKEYEFSIKPSPNAEFDQGYIFLLEDDTASVASYFWYPALLPKLFLQKPELTITAHNATRPAGEVNPFFTISYTGFVDGDNESVLDVPPNITCSANISSPSGNYDIVPYGADDNKYDFKNVVGVLNVTPSVDFEDNKVERISIYPNPANDFIYFTGIIPGNTNAKIYNLTGSLVFEAVIEGSKIDIRSLNTGIYILNLDGLVFKVSKE